MTLCVSDSGVQVPGNSGVVCQRIRINGVVQGVGFRPLVWRLAKELGLTGWVRNDAQGVELEVCGGHEKVDALLQRLHHDAPPMARIDAITSRFTESVSVSEDFFILDSRGGRSATMIGPDMTVCRDCLAEMFDPNGRRWRYALTNCGHCGPRYSICSGLPYDRARTSLKPFAMCRKCEAEYLRAHDRRLHAEGNCCPKCGPQLSLVDASGAAIGGDPIAQTLGLIRDGRIVAVKGPGGFHLFCDARNPAAVALMRERKRRQVKPFAVMFASASSVIPYVQLRVGEPGLLALSERPIILLNKRKGCDEKLPGVAPDLPWLGVVLPFSPIHYLLFHEAAGRPAGLDWLDSEQSLALLISSGNRSREPIAIDNEEAMERLSGLADAFLLNDRTVVTRCDDSIACSGPGGLQLIRRARGYAPKAVKLPQSGPPVLAVGGPVKNAVCVTRGGEAFLSQHIGELSNPAASAGFEATIRHLLKMLEVAPSLIAHDLRRDDYTTSLIETMAHQREIPLLAVQHHHAHVAAVLAEHHINEPTFGLALDGGELGTDGTLWGGELLKIDGARFERFGHLAPISLLGDDAESREPWRLAAVMLQMLGRGQEIERRFAAQPDAARLIAELAGSGAGRRSSSLGRLFDAASGLLGFRQMQIYRDQAGLLMEGAAEGLGETPALSAGWRIANGQLDLLPLFDYLADETNPARGAAVFYATTAAALTEWVCSVVPAGARIAAGGGCLQNQVFAGELRSRLSQRGLHLMEARRVPPSDGGLALGQAWVAQRYLLGAVTKAGFWP